jgi:hypothetical protein
MFGGTSLRDDLRFGCPSFGSPLSALLYGFKVWLQNDMSLTERNEQFRNSESMEIQCKRTLAETAFGNIVNLACLDWLVSCMEIF